MSETAADIEAERELTLARLITDYQTTFGSDEGARVLADLTRHFDPMRAVFCSATQFDLARAAVSDGQRQVLIHIFMHVSREITRDGKVGRLLPKVILPEMPESTPLPELP